MKRINFLTLAALALTMAACNNDDLNPGTGPEGIEGDAYASFTIKLPQSPRATEMETGTPEENAVKKMNVFIFDAEAPFNMTMGEFSGNTLIVEGGTVKSTKAIKTKRANKKIFIGLNMTTAMVNEVTSLGQAAFGEHTYAATLASLTSTSNGFVMFNDEVPGITAGASLSQTEQEAAANPIRIGVDRVVAKASMMKTNTFNVYGGGRFEDLKYGWRNINKSLYFMPIRNTDDHRIDYNYLTGSALPAHFEDAGTDAEVAEYSNTVAPDNFVYTTENLFKFIPGETLVQEATYISVSGYFIPDYIWVYENGTNANVYTDFDRVDNTQPKGTTFYTVYDNQGATYYFTDRIIAERFVELAEQNAEGMPTLANSTINEYVNGVGYFHAFVNGGDEFSAPSFNVERNTYFVLNLNSLYGPGMPGDNIDGPDPIVNNAMIDVLVSINPWTVIVEDNIDL